MIRSVLSRVDLAESNKAKSAIMQHKHNELLSTPLPSIGLGTFKLAGETCTKVVTDALAVGYRHIDTASRYDNESAVGAGIVASGIPRERIFVTTKLPLDCEARDVAGAVVHSLRRLKTDYVDLLLIHWPSRRVRSGGTIEGMLEAQAAGLVRHVGVANFPHDLLAKVEQYPLFANQIEYHPLLSQRKTVSATRRAGMYVIAHTPLARGRAVTDPTVVKWAEELNISPAQLLLRWLTQQQNVVAIPRTSNPIHLVQNHEAALLTLPEPALAALDQLGCGYRVADPLHAPDWPGE